SLLRNFSQAESNHQSPCGPSTCQRVVSSKVLSALTLRFLMYHRERLKSLIHSSAYFLNVPGMHLRALDTIRLTIQGGSAFLLARRKMVISTSAEQIGVTSVDRAIPLISNGSWATRRIILPLAQLTDSTYEDLP